MESMGRKYVFGKYGEEVCIWKVWGGSMYLESMERKGKGGRRIGEGAGRGERGKGSRRGEEVSWRKGEGGRGKVDGGGRRRVMVREVILVWELIITKYCNTNIFKIHIFPFATDYDTLMYGI